MQTLHNLYREDAEVFESLGQAIKKPPRFPASHASEKSAAMRKFWQDLAISSRHRARRFHLVARRGLRSPLALSSSVLQKLTK